MGKTHVIVIVALFAAVLVAGCTAEDFPDAASNSGDDDSGGQCGSAGCSWDNLKCGVHKCSADERTKRWTCDDTSCPRHGDIKCVADSSCGSDGGDSGGSLDDYTWH